MNKTMVVFIMSLLSAMAITVAVILELNRRTMEATRELGQCVVEQMAEHRIDNRNSHEAMSEEHFTLNPDFDKEGLRSLPPPPRSLPRPRDDIQDELIEACEDYLHQSRLSRSFYEP